MNESNSRAASGNGKYDSYKIVGQGHAAVAEFHLVMPDIDVLSHKPVYFHRFDLTSLQEHVSRAREHHQETGLEQQALAALQKAAMRQTPKP